MAAPSHVTHLSHMKAILSFTAENSNSGAQPGGLWESPHPPGGSHFGNTLEKDRHQSSSSLEALVPEPKYCVKVSPTVSSCHHSTSHTNSGFFLAKEVMFHVSIISQHHQESARRFLSLPAIQLAVHLTVSQADPMGHVRTTRHLLVSCPPRPGWYPGGYSVPGEVLQRLVQFSATAYF